MKPSLKWNKYDDDGTETSYTVAIGPFYLDATINHDWTPQRKIAPAYFEICEWLEADGDFGKRLEFHAFHDPIDIQELMVRAEEALRERIALAAKDLSRCYLLGGKAPF